MFAEKKYCTVSPLMTKDGLVDLQWVWCWEYWMLPKLSGTDMQSNLCPFKPWIFCRVHRVFDYSARGL